MNRPSSSPGQRPGMTAQWRYRILLPHLRPSLTRSRSPKPHSQPGEQQDEQALGEQGCAAAELQSSAPHTSNQMHLTLFILSFHRILPLKGYSAQCACRQRQHCGRTDLPAGHRAHHLRQLQLEHVYGARHARMGQVVRQLRHRIRHRHDPLHAAHPAAAAQQPVRRHRPGHAELHLPRR